MSMLNLDHPVLKQIEEQAEAAFQQRRKHKAKKANVRARKEAYANGQATYIGLPCQHHGIGAPRNTTNGVCVECHREQSRAYRLRQKAELEEMRAALGWTKHIER